MNTAVLSLVLGIASLASLSHSCDLTTTTKLATPAEARAYFTAQRKTVLTLLGYSGAEYEDKAAMLDEAGRIMAQFDPATTIVNIGATREGIGAAYEIAKRRRFVTTGIVSIKAKEYSASLSPCVDVVFFIQDDSWGGRLPGTDQLSPTSSAMGENSDVMVAIGGGDIARDEIIAAKRAGKQTRYVPADMNHRIARHKAAKQGQAPPTDFSGSVSSAF
jgi:hypothetical protein